MTIEIRMDNEAERNTIAVALVDPAQIPLLAGIVTAADFSPATAPAWKAIIELFETGAEVNRITVAAELARRNELETIGGNLFLIDAIRYLPYANEGDFWARIVKQHAANRDLIRAGAALQVLVRDNPDDWQANANRGIEILLGILSTRPRTETQTASEVLRAGLFDDIEERMENPTALRGIPSGWYRFDRMLGGFQRKRVYLYGAETSMGKSLWGNDLVRRLATAGYRVLVFSTEMGNNEVASRIIFQLAGVNPDKQAFSPDERERVRDAMEQFDTLPIVFCERGDLALGYLRSEVRRITALQGRVDLVVIDHVDMVTGSGQNRTSELEGITRGLKALAMQEDVAVVEVSHLSRLTDNNKSSKTARFRNSESKAQDADVAWFMAPVAEDDSPMNPDDARRRMSSEGKLLLALDVTKNRSGRTGAVRMLLNWHQGGRFFEVDR